MSTEDATTTDRPDRTQTEHRSPVSDPRDDLRGQMETHRRDLEDFFARRQVSPYAKRGVKRIFTH